MTTKVIPIFLLILILLGNGCNQPLLAPTPVIHATNSITPTVISSISTVNPSATNTPIPTITSQLPTPTLISKQNIISHSTLVTKTEYIAIEANAISLTGQPNQGVTYTLTITNTAPISITYDIRAYSANTDFDIDGLEYDLRSGYYWQNFYDVEPLGRRELIVEVNIPDYATNGSFHKTLVRIYGPPPIDSNLPTAEFNLTTLVTSETSIQEISHLNLTAQAISVQDSYAYIAAGADGLRIFDISEPATPLEVSFYNKDMGAWDVIIKGDYAYVIFGDCDQIIYGKWYSRCNDSGLYILDISNPNQPFEVGLYEQASQWQKLESLHNYIYAVDGAGWLHVLDISDPIVLKEMHLPDKQINDFFIADEYLYLIPPNGFAYKAGGGITSNSFIEIVDPISLTEIGTYRFPETFPAIEVLVVASQALVHSNIPCGGVCSGPIGGWLTIDISMPTSIKEINTNYRPKQAQAVITSNKYAYIADGKAGLRILDISDPTQLIEVDSFGVGQSNFALDVALVEGYIYLASNRGGLFVLRYNETD